MASGKYSRVDGRKSSLGYCSTVTIVVFVVLCLVGVWMMTSSSVVPVWSSDVSKENNNEVRTHVSESNEDNNRGTSNDSVNNASDDSSSSDDGKTKQFEDNPGDLPEDATKGDSNASSNQEEKNDKFEETEKTAEENPEEKSKDEKKEYIEEKKEDEEEKNGGETKEDGELQKENKDSETGETNKSNSDDNEKKSGENSSDLKDGEKGDGQIEEKVDEEKDKELDQVSGEKKDQTNEDFPSGAQSDLLKETITQNGAFSTQAAESKNEKEAWQGEKMKTILSSETMDIPDGVKIKVKAKMIEVEGPRGKLTRNFKHLNLDFQLITDEETGKRKLKVDAWFGSRKTTAAIRTALSHVNNLITGVTRGYRYKMRFVYAHFPINASIANGNKSIEIRNFLGEKKVRKVDMLEGVNVVRSEKVKDELVLDGNDIELVSRSCALINQKCHVKNKDIRKFLDGIYISEKGTIVEEE